MTASKEAGPLANTNAAPAFHTMANQITGHFSISRNKGINYLALTQQWTMLLGHLFRQKIFTRGSVGKRSYTPPQCGSPIRSTFSSKVAPYLLEGATHQNRIMKKELWSQPITSNSYGCDPRYVMLYIPIYLMVYVAEAHCHAKTHTALQSSALQCQDTYSIAIQDTYKTLSFHDFARSVRSVRTTNEKHLDGI